MYSDTKGMSSDNYVVIQGWMCNELNLKGNELLVFALIYGFCQDGKSLYSGGRQYIADTFNISIRTVTATLQSLVEHGLIIRHESNDFVHPDIYTVTGNRETLVGSEKISLGVVKKLHGGSEKIALNNTSNKLIDNTDTNVSVAKPSVIAEHSDKTKRKPLISSSVSESLSNTESVSNPVSNTSNKHIKNKTNNKNSGVVSPIKKKNLYEKCMDEIEAYTDDKELRELLKTYLPIRMARKDIVINLPTFRGMLKTLNRVADTREDKIKSIQQSIDRNYPTFYEPHKGYTRQKKDVFSEYGKVKSEKKDEVVVNVQF